MKMARRAAAAVGAAPVAPDHFPALVVLTSQAIERIRAEVASVLRSFGPNTVIVTKTAAMGNATREERRRKPLTLDDARSIAERSGPAVPAV
jgi:hypothetical protein